MLNVCTFYTFYMFLLGQRACSECLGLTWSFYVSERNNAVRTYFCKLDSGRAKNCLLSITAIANITNTEHMQRGACGLAHWAALRGCAARLLCQDMWHAELGVQWGCCQYVAVVIWPGSQCLSTSAKAAACDRLHGRRKEWFWIWASLAARHVVLHGGAGRCRSCPWLES